jgi:hypothetical protein
LLKNHWAQSREQTACPVTTLGSLQKPKEDQGGLLVSLDEAGQIQATLPLTMPAGMAQTEQGLLVAALDTIYEVSPDLTAIKKSVSLPSFSLLHSLNRTARGYLVASTGVDAIVEFSRDGDPLWSWWATEHGFEETPTGERRILDTTADHRGVKYGTLTQTTHVNSATEWKHDTILATLFHQGSIVAIERETGRWQTVLSGLNHPHSVRVLDDHYVTVADTGHGRALLVHLKDGQGIIEHEVTIETDWLQDSYYDIHAERWYLVDGKNSRVVIQKGLAGSETLAELQLDPEWRLYEAHPLH